MSPVEKLEKEVRALYEARHDGRADYADLLYEHHVFEVARQARRAAKRFGGDPDLAYASGMLHDIADAVMLRENSDHESKSAEIARELMRNSGFRPEHISVVVDDALRYHSCRGDERPRTAEGKALAAGDAVAHLTTNIYPLLIEKFRARGESEEEIGDWLLKKTDRDFHSKIAYPEVQNEVEQGYEALRKPFIE
jgi:putative nucleotidyltransferase with HDIG domain